MSGWSPSQEYRFHQMTLQAAVMGIIDVRGVRRASPLAQSGGRKAVVADEAMKRGCRGELKEHGEASHTRQTTQLVCFLNPHYTIFFRPHSIFLVYFPTAVRSPTLFTGTPHLQ
jgi:hypothetical protein